MDLSRIIDGDAGQDPSQVNAGIVPTAVASALERPATASVAPGLLDGLQDISRLPLEVLGEIGKHADLATRRNMRLAGKCKVGLALQNAVQVATRAVIVKDRIHLARALHLYTAGGLDTLTIEDAKLMDDDLKGLPASLRTLTLSNCEGVTPIGLAHLNNLRLPHSM
jgi:hypothetical protein